MAEIASSTATGIALATGAITVSGSIIGVQYDALLVGLAGGLISLSYLPPMPKLKVASTIFTSVMVAGFFAPVAEAIVAKYAPWMNAGNPLRMALAFALGICAQRLIPLLVSWVQKKGGEQ
ncbi:MAG: hypothetical protein HYZ45_04935 [Burkholderiales bacterium]|nr:hypothetical protein [Burkholderiales bacterium]